jgi:putative NADH-flavin reductase
MPVIVIGADTPLGGEVLGALQHRGGEVRAFVSSEAEGARLRDTPIRVAVGDVSDGSHVAGAALECFSAVLVTEAAADGRERAFAADAAAVHAAWADAVGEAGVTRAIWVGAPPPTETTPETYVVGVAGRDAAEVASEVAALDDRPAVA